MSSEQVDFSMSQLSLTSSDTEDWDRSMSSDADPNHASTPRNSVSFPGHSGADVAAVSQNGSLGRGAGRRTLSELLKLHAEKGTDVNFTPEEASRVAEVLGQWVSVLVSPHFVLQCSAMRHLRSLRYAPAVIMSRLMRRRRY